MSRKKSKTSQPLVFNSIKFAPADFGQVGFIGKSPVSLYALDCAINQGLATGVTIMNEKMMTLPMATVQAAVPPGRQHPWWSKVNHPGRLRLHPLLVEHPSEPGQYILVAGADLVRAAATEGVTHLDCVVVPYHTAMAIGSALINGFVCPPNGQVTLTATTPAAQPAKQSYAGKDLAEKLDEEAAAEDDAPRKKPLRNPAPAVSQTGITHGLNLHANLLLPLAINAATVEDGEVVVHANSAAEAARAMLADGDQKGLDIIIKYASREAGAAGISLHEFALTLFLNHLFHRVKKMAAVKDRRRAGHSLAQAKRGTHHWPGSPRSFQNWVETRSHLFACSNEFWNHSIPDALFERCVALRYGVAEPTPVQLDSYLFELIRVAFKALDLASHQTSNLRDLHRANYATKRRPPARRVINEAVDGISGPRMGESHQVDEVDRFMLAVLGRINSGKIWRDKAHQTLMYQWLVAIGDLARTGKMIVSCLMAQEFVLVDRERKAGRSIDAGWMVFGAALAVAVEGRCSETKAYRELLSLCQEAMRGSYGMIVSRTSWGKATLVSEPLSASASIAAETPILLF